MPAGVVAIAFREKRDSHLCDIHCSQFDLRGFATPKSAIPATLDHITLIKLLHCLGPIVHLLCLSTVIGEA